MENSNIDLSIIVIGKNEGWKLTKCIGSILKTIEYNNILNYEIIYIDSKSTDDSIQRAKQQKLIKIFQLTSDCNAAIARNVGYKVSYGENLFFLDADMELIPEVFPEFYSNSDGLSKPFLSGNLKYYYYDKGWNFIFKESKPHIRIDRNTYQSKVGGLFFIKRKLWESVNGMKSYLKMGEDVDFSFRLAKKRCFLYRINTILVNHHTISYLSDTRKWESLINGSVLLGQSCIFRENILNKYSWKRMFRQNYTLFILLGIALLTVFTSFWYLFSLYFLTILFRAILRRTNILSNFFYYLLRDIILIFGFIFYYPNKKMSIEFKQIV